MESIDKYRQTIKKIVEYANGHGINSIGLDRIKNKTPDQWDEQLKREFLVACHDGFKIAQKLLIKEITKYQSLLRLERTKFKEIRRQRNKIKEAKEKSKIAIIEQRLHSLSHIANSIAWQLLGGQIHIARRFHIEQDSAKFLDSSNIKHSIKVANEINKNPEDFALISDLTNFLQIGDLLVRHDNKMAVMELKEGEVNDLISNFFETIEKHQCPYQDTRLMAKLNDTTIKQIDRRLRQQERALNAINVINTDKGIDPVSGKNILVSTPRTQTEYYYNDLIRLENEIKNKIWAYTIVDNCLHIGAYREEGLLMAPFAIEQILKEKTKNFIMIDWLSITRNLSQPLFAKPLSRDFNIDILSGRIKVIMGLDIDSLIELFNLLGLKTRWLSEKETAKARQNAIRQGLIVVNKRGISVTLLRGQEVNLSGGTLSKIFYDNINPSCVALSLLTLEDDLKNTKNSR